MNEKPKTTDEYIHYNRESIAERIKTFRDKKGYSQDELAEKMGMKSATISRIEEGRFSINVDILIKFGWFLDFDVYIIEKKV